MMVVAVCGKHTILEFLDKLAVEDGYLETIDFMPIKKREDGVCELCGNKAQFWIRIHYFQEELYTVRELKE